MNIKRFVRKVWSNPCAQSREKGVMSSEEHAGESGDLNAIGRVAKVGVHGAQKEGDEAL